MHRIILALIFGVFYTSVLSAQVWAIPMQMDRKMQTGEKVEHLEFFKSPYSGKVIDLRSFRRQIGNYDLPSQIKIVPPDLSQFSDTTLIMTYLKDGTLDEGALVIWITGNFETNEVTFYIDKNLDYDYTNDGPPIIKKSKSSAQIVTLTPTDVDQPTRIMSIGVAHKKKNKRETQIEGLSGHAKIKNRFALGVQLGIGNSNLDFEFDNIDLGYPTWYEVPITEANLSLTGTYNLGAFFFGVRGTAQSMNYWTAYYNERFGPVNIGRDPITRLPLIDNVDIKRNIDQHSKFRFQLGGILGARIPVGSSMEIQPYMVVGKTFYADKEYLPNKFKSESSFAQDPSNFIEGGIRIEFSVGNFKGLYLGTGFSKLWWKPTGYFESLPAENVEINYRSIPITFGYRMAIF